MPVAQGAAVAAARVGRITFALDALQAHFDERELSIAYAAE